MTKNYLFVIDRIENGGAERQLLAVAKYVSENVTIHITALHTPTSDMLLYIEECGFIYHSISKNDGGNLFTRLRGVLKLIKSLKKLLIFNKIDKCISFLEWSNILSIVSTRKLGIPVIANVRNHLSTQYGSRDRVTLFIAKLIITKFYPRAEQVICNSFGIKNDLVKNFKLPEGQISVIQNTYSINKLLFLAESHLELLPLSSKGIRFCACGRLSDQKRFESLVLTFQSFVKITGRNDSLIIIGSGPNKNSIQDLITKDKANIKLISHTENPYPLISQSDCFLLNSEFEGFPNVLAEALILGKDCISVDCLTGPREVLSGNVLTNYGYPITIIKVLEYGLLYPYNKTGVEVDDGLLEALIKYSNGNFQFNKLDHNFLCEKRGKIRWQKILSA